MKADNIITYVKNFQYTFSESPFNDVDSLILCQLSYLKMKNIVPTIDMNCEFVTFSEIADKKNHRRLFADIRFREQNKALVEALLESRRFQELSANYYIDILDKVMEVQFSAVTFRLSPDLYFVAYRGTDEYLVGWKEDVTFGFSEPVVVQLYAAKYLQKVSTFLPDDFYVGGHSKGGNLATFAVMTAPGAIQDRVLLVYNNDGPSFKPEVLTRYEYERIAYKVKKILPRASLVGMLLQHDDDYEVIDSSSYGIIQHDPYSWLVEEDHFIRAEKLDYHAKLADSALNEWILSQDDETIRMFAEVLFQVMDGSESDNLIDMTIHWKKSLSGMYQAMRDMDESTKQEMEKLFKELFEISRRLAREEFRNRVEESVEELKQKVRGKVKERNKKKEHTTMD